MERGAKLAAPGRAHNGDVWRAGGTAGIVGKRTGSGATGKYREAGPARARATLHQGCHARELTRVQPNPGSWLRERAAGSGVNGLKGEPRASATGGCYSGRSRMGRIFF